MFSRNLLMLLCALLLSTGAWALEPLVLAPGLEKQTFNAELRYRIDPSGTLTLNDLLAEPDTAWQNGDGSVPNYGFSRSAWWFHVRLHNPAPQALTRLLEIDYALLDVVELYQLQPGHPLRHDSAGNAVPFRSRPVPHRHLVFPVTVDAQATADLYLRVKASYGMQLPMTLWEERAFWQNDQGVLAWQFLYYGLILVMVLYNLFLAWGVRDSTYLYYMLSVGSVGLFQMALHGSAYQFLWPDAVRWNALSMAFLMPLSNACSSLFANRMLGIREHFPRLFWVLWSQVLLVPLLLLAALVFPVELVNPVSSALVVPTALVVGICAIRRWMDGQLEARYFTMAWNLFVLGCLLLALSKFGVLPYHWLTENLMQIGSAVETVLLSLALAVRINRMRQKSVALAQKQLEVREQALQAEAQVMEAKYESKAKSDFLAVMSHEIRTPMNGVLGVLELLRDTPLNPQQTELVNTVQSSGRLLLNIINDILDFSKIEAGKMELEHIRFSLRQLIQDAVTINVASAQPKSLLLAWHVAPAIAEQLVGDPSRLKQVLYNLLANAIKFTGHGHVFVRARLLDDRDGTQRLRVDVQDSGIGMSAEQQQRLFNPFTQADKSTSRKYGGTGLGLAISQKLIQAMNGTIGVETRPGQGSTFWFELTLPVAVPATPPPPPARRQRLWLCADYLPWLEWIETSLDRQHFELHSLVLNGTGELADALDTTDEPALLLWPGAPSARLVRGSATAVRRCLLACNATGETAGDSPELQQIAAPFNLNAIVSPLTPQTAATPAVPAARTSALRPLYVLVAEDNRVNQMVIRELLRPLVGDVEMVANGREALEKFRSAIRPFDVIFMDCEMPEMDGYEATLRIREYERRRGLDRRVPVVALTAHAFDEFKQKAFAAGMNAHLSKPVTRAALHAYLAEHFGLSHF